MYNLFIVYLLQNLISQTILVFECHNMKCRFEVRSTCALVIPKGMYVMPMWETYTYIYTLFCKLELKSSVMYICITCSLIHFITYSYLNDHLLNMVSILNTHHNCTFFTNVKLMFIILKHSVLILTYLCTQNTAMFLCKYMLISPFLVLRIYSWACTKSCFFKNIVFHIWKSSHLFAAGWSSGWYVRMSVDRAP